MGPVLGLQVRTWIFPHHTPAISHSLPVGKVSCLARLQRAPGPGLTDSFYNPIPSAAQADASAGVGVRAQLTRLRTLAGPQIAIGEMPGMGTGRGAGRCPPQPLKPLLRVLRQWGLCFGVRYLDSDPGSASHSYSNLGAIAFTLNKPQFPYLSWGKWSRTMVRVSCDDACAHGKQGVSPPLAYEAVVIRHPLSTQS